MVLLARVKQRSLSSGHAHTFPSAPPINGNVWSGNGHSLISTKGRAVASKTFAMGEMQNLLYYSHGNSSCNLGMKV